MPAIEKGISRGQLIPLVFGQDAVAASQTDVQLPVPMGEATQVVDGYPMAFAGEIVGVSAGLSAAATAGTLTVGATVGGTEDADTTLTITTATNAYKRVNRGKATFVAGDRIGCEITSSGTWDATTSDLVAVVWVLVYLAGI